VAARSLSGSVIRPAASVAWPRETPVVSFRDDTSDRAPAGFPGCCHRQRHGCGRDRPPVATSIRSCDSDVPPGGPECGCATSLSPCRRRPSIPSSRADRTGSHAPTVRTRARGTPQARHHLVLRGGSTRRSQSRSAARTKAACETPTSSASRARCAAMSGCSWITSFLVSRAALTLGSRVTVMRAASRLGQGNGARRDRFGSGETAGRGRVSRRSETFLWARAIRRSPVLIFRHLTSQPRPPLRSRE
jgi:hypothetical protein